MFIQQLDPHALTLHFIDELLEGHREYSNTLVHDSFVIHFDVHNVCRLAVQGEGQGLVELTGYTAAIDGASVLLVAIHGDGNLHGTRGQQTTGATTHNSKTSVSRRALRAR